MDSAGAESKAHALRHRGESAGSTNAIQAPTLTVFALQETMTAIHGLPDPQVCCCQ
jgi:hypothetical protein